MPLAFGVFTQSASSESMAKLPSDPVFCPCDLLRYGQRKAIQLSKLDSQTAMLVGMLCFDITTKRK